jgi:hypothetical protein
MVAQELVNGVPLGADVAVEKKEDGEKLKKIFQVKNLTVNIIV